MMKDDIAALTALPFSSIIRTTLTNVSFFPPHFGSRFEDIWLLLPANLVAVDVLFMCEYLYFTKCRRLYL